MLPVRNVMRFIIRLNFVAIFIALPIVGQSAGFAQSLRQEAQKLGLQVGAAVDPARFSEPLYAETVANQFNMVEPENAMKWPATEPARGHLESGVADGRSLHSGSTAQHHEEPYHNCSQPLSR